MNCIEKVNQVENIRLIVDLTFHSFSLFFRSQNKEVQAQSSMNRKSQNGSKTTKVESMLSAGNIDRALNWASFAIIYVKTGSVYKL